MESKKDTAEKHAGGRPRLVEDGDWRMITCKAPPELHAEFLALGGSAWLREHLAKSARRRAKQETPPAEG